MGSRYAVQVRLSRAGGLPADDCVNTWHFVATADADPTDIGSVFGRIANWYSATPGGVVAPATYLANTVNDTVAMKLYDLNDALPRAPLALGTFSLGAIRTDPLPAEVAVCLSYRAAAVSGLPAARRRGRIFFGPLGINAMASGAGAGDARVASLCRSALTGASSRLLTANTADLYWAVYSPTNAAMVAVDNGYVDDAWDTQRRRGAKAVTRTNFP